MYMREMGVWWSTSDSYDRLQQTCVVLSLVVVVSVMLPAGP